MELIVIGAGPAYTIAGGRRTASYLVRAGGAALLLDLGRLLPQPGSTLERANSRQWSLVHLHPDHFIDLVPLRHYLRFEFDPPRRVRVLGPAGLGERIDALHAAPGSRPRLWIWRRSPPGRSESEPLRWRPDSRPTRRELRVPGLRGWGRGRGAAAPGLVYSGDCGRAEDLVPLIRSGIRCLPRPRSELDPSPTEPPTWTPLPPPAPPLPAAPPASC